MKQITVLGDIMLDRYIFGDAQRISPEAPVPVVNVTKEEYKLGGAANVAANLSHLKVNCLLIGGLGADQNGKELKSLCLQNDIKLEAYEVLDQTTTKTRVVARNQQMLRIDRESTILRNELDVEHVVSSINYKNTDCIIISDYLKGFCSVELTKAIIHQSKKYQCKILIDPKGTDWAKYEGAWLVKPNLSELEYIYGKTTNNDDELVELHGKKIREQFQFEYLLVTRGAKGMTLISASEVKHFHTQQVDVFDVTGAGDTSLAVLAWSIAEGQDLATAIQYANLASSYVVTKPMTYAISLEEMEALIVK